MLMEVINYFFFSVFFPQEVGYQHGKTVFNVWCRSGVLDKMLKDRQETCKSKTDVSAQGNSAGAAQGWDRGQCPEVDSQLRALDFLAEKFQLVLRKQLTFLFEEFWIIHYKIRAHCASSPLNGSDLKPKCYKGFVFYPVILFYHLLE